MSTQTKDKLIALLWAAISAAVVAFFTSLANGLGSLDLSAVQQVASVAAGGMAAYTRLLPLSS